MDTVLLLLGWTGSVLIVLSVMQARVLRFRWMNFAGSLLATVFNVALGIWPFAAMNAAIAAISGYWIIRLTRERHDAQVYRVIPVTPDDLFLQHILSTHAKDIAHKQPGFTPLPAAGAPRTAFLVVRGDENVGVVAIRDEGAGVGLVELDWVKPAFRDFTPGEFVYRESGVLTAAGFERLEVETTPATDREYLRKMGFTTDRTRWVRNVAA
jgi:hypothetical protein